MLTSLEQNFFLPFYPFTFLICLPLYFFKPFFSLRFTFYFYLVPCTPCTLYLVLLQLTPYNLYLTTCTLDLIPHALYTLYFILLYPIPYTLYLVSYILYLVSFTIKKNLETLQQNKSFTRDQERLWDSAPEQELTRDQEEPRFSLLRCMHHGNSVSAGRDHAATVDLRHFLRMDITPLVTMTRDVQDLRRRTCRTTAQ